MRPELRAEAFSSIERLRLLFRNLDPISLSVPPRNVGNIMIIDKSVFDVPVNGLKQLAQKYSFAQNATDPSQDLEKQLVAFKGQVKQYAFRVLMLGVFSSGKSAFLNTLLQADLLNENQTPETTVATELCFDMREFIEAVALDGTVTQFPIDQLASIDGAKYSNLILHLNNDFLRQHADTIFVDMPGIDSNFEIHNRAINNYIGKGSAYMLLVSVQEGSLRQSLVDFLKELNYYPQSLACFVSKSDLMPPDQVQSVVQNVQAGINAVFHDYEPVEVQAVSAQTDLASDFQGKVEQCLARFNPQIIFESKLGQELAQIIRLFTSSLLAYRNSISLDLTEIDKRIKQCRDAKDDLEMKLSNKEVELSSSSSSIANLICSDVEQALRTQEEQLVSAAMSGTSELNNAIMGIVRPVIVSSSQQHCGDYYQDIVNSLNLSGISSNIDIGSDVSANGGQAGSSLSDEQISGLTNIAKNLVSSFAGDKNGHSPVLYNVVTGAAALTTSVLNPILEAIIVFLPQILSSLFGGQSREEQQEQQRQERYNRVRNAVQSQVIPQVVQQVRPTICQNIEQHNKDMLKQVRASFSQLIDGQNSALEQAKAEAAQKEQDHKQKLADVDNDLNQLQAWLVQLQASN